MMISVGTSFFTMTEARDAVFKALLDEDLSWVVHKSDTKRFHLKCKVGSCKFEVVVVYSKQLNEITLRQ